MVDTISEALGLSSLDHNIDLDKLFEEHGLIRFDTEICRKEALERNAEIVTCDKCGVSGNRPNMMRWHFENCKTVFRNCQFCSKIIPRQGVKDSQYNKKIFCGRECYMKSKVGKAPIIMTEEVKNKLKKPKSKEHRKKLSEARKGRILGPRNKK